VSVTIATSVAVAGSFHKTLPFHLHCRDIALVYGMNENTTPHTISTIIDKVRAGLLDNYLDSIYSEINLRRKLVKITASDELKVGDKAVITGNLRPKYIVGLEVTVTKLNGVTVSVDMPTTPDARRYAGIRGVRVPRTCIRPA
jgi:hypothetical protein